MRSKEHVIIFIKESVLEFRKVFLLSLVLVFSYKGLSVLLPFVMGTIIDHVTGGVNGLMSNLGLFVFIAICLVVLMPLQDFVMSTFVQKVMLQRSIEWVSKIFKKDLEFFNNYNVGNLVNAIDRGIAAHEKLLFHINGHLLPVVVEFLVVFTLVFWFGAWKLTIGFIILLAAQYLIINHLIVRRRTQVELVNDAEDEMAGEMTELLSNGLIFKLEQKEEQAIKRMITPLREYAQQSVALAVSSALMDSVKFFGSNLLTLGTIIYGVLAINEKTMSVGELVTLLTIAARLSSAFNDFLQSKKVFDQFDADVTEFLNVLSYDEFDRDGDISKCVYEYAVDHYVSDRFTIDQKLVINPGEKIAIVGSTGQGKSTLIDILSGVTREARKSVILNGRSLEEFNSSNHLNLMRYCPQDHYLVSGSVIENVGLEQNSLMERLGLNKEICNGQKILSERASNISGGEAKRLSLARMLSRPGDVMLFDEPTSALNEQVASMVWSEIFDICKDRTVITSTHDYSELNRFDRILIVKGGRIVADGCCRDIKENWEFKSLVG